MFFLSLIEHTLRLPPHLLDLPLNEAIKGELESLFLDKVIANLGLCISVYDIRSIDGGFVFPGDGASTYTVEFRLVMFRPFVGEIITAKLKESDANGLQYLGSAVESCKSLSSSIVEVACLVLKDSLVVPCLSEVAFEVSLGFFDDIYIPVHLMPNPCHCEADPENKSQVIWIWDYQEQKFPIDGLDEIRFQVQSVSYPPIPVEQPKESKPFAPMMIMGSLDYDGLGPVSWW
ncbi:DNA-directed RNA polymerase III subunit RPC8 [Vitis vinifera]|uniref:DNA-directed RNA polymerase subunit n=1 Tax=Vitis vinifera TaxID=29760 RepID=A0A438F4R4_VITVI|nr:DNA-directed RNA polymerase III subunit RPC8 [Vitis vinifera]